MSVDITEFNEDESQQMQQMLASNAGFAALAPFVYQIMRHNNPQINSIILTNLNNHEEAQSLAKLIMAARAIAALRMIRQELFQREEWDNKLPSKMAFQHPDIEKQEQIEVEEIQKHHLNYSAVESELEALGRLERDIYVLTAANDIFDLTLESALALENNVREIDDLRLEHVQNIVKSFDNTLSLNEFDNDFLKNRMDFREYAHNRITPDMRMRADKIYEYWLSQQLRPLAEKKDQSFYEAQLRRVALVAAEKGMDEENVKQAPQNDLEKTMDFIGEGLEIRKNLEQKADELNQLKENVDDQQKTVVKRLRNVDANRVGFKKRTEENDKEHSEDPTQSPGAPIPTVEPNANAKPSSPVQIMGRKESSQQVGALRDQVIYQYLRLASYLLIFNLETNRGITAESFSARQNKMDDILVRQQKQESVGRSHNLRPTPPGAIG